MYIVHMEQQEYIGLVVQEYKMKKLLWLFIVVMLFPTMVYAQGLPLKDGSASTLATISDCQGSINCLRSTGPTTATGAGFQALTGITGAGATSSSKRFNPTYTSEAGGQRQAVPVMLWDDTFNSTTQNTSKYRAAFTTQTITGAGGFVNLNASAITTINTNSAYQTFKVFPLFAKSELRVNFSALHTVAPQTNATTEWGVFTATIPGGAAPIDGCFFRFNAAAEFRGVCSYNTTEVQTAAITAPTINVVHDYVIVVQTNTVYFMVDDSVVGTLTLLTDAPGVGQPMAQATVPITFRHYIGGSAPASAMQFKVSDIFVTSLGPDLGRTWAEDKAGFGHMAYQGQNGGTMGTTANTLNGATPAASALTNTAISTGSPVGLGGLAHVLPTLAVGTDGILFSFQNPTGSVTQTPRNLIIRGVNISGGVDLVLSAAAVMVLSYSLAYGHTAISMATAESASFTSGTTKAPRRIWLGVLTTLIAAAAGTPLNGGPLAVKFDSPVVVAPGEFVAITMRNQGVVSATGSLIINAAFDAYFE